LKRLGTEGDGFLRRIVTGDETWVHYHQPETKKASKVCRHNSSPKSKKFRTQPFAGEVMLTEFKDEQEVILKYYMPVGITVTSATCADPLKNQLLPAIKSKNHGFLITGGLLQHENVLFLTDCSNVATNQDLPIEYFPYPPYSPDPAPSDFHVFGPLKEAMG
jgi:histone-lysine N-methyltransferase SETMAR